MSHLPAVNVVAFLDIGFAEIVVVAFVALLLFGGRLPEVMRTLGQTYRNFRRGVEGLTRETTKIFDVRAPQTPYRPTPPAASPAPGSAPWMPVVNAPPVPMPTAHTSLRADTGPAAEASPVPATAPALLAADLRTAAAAAPTTPTGSTPSSRDEEPPPV